jgi:hypothetical protein
VAEPEGQPREALWMLTFPLSKASPGAYSNYRNIMMCLLYFLCMCCLYTTCRVLYGDVISCMVAPFHKLSLL